jgi:purine-nucleoside phosphorylase
MSIKGKREKNARRRLSEPVGSSHELLATAVAAVRDHLGAFRPKVAIVLGSGLGGLASSVGKARRIPYGEIPGFPTPGVVGHSGELVFGEVEGVPVILQSGRFHMYEGHAPEVVALPIRVFADLGVGTLIVTNAAGGIRHTFRPPVLMLIADQINLMWRYPLRGPVAPGEERFPDMSEPYSRSLRDLARQVARSQGIRVEEGVYVAVLGPSFETPAEVRMLQQLGADAVGMSTVPEVTVARARGLRVLGISTISNFGAGLTPHPLSHEEVLEAGRAVAQDLERLVRGVVAALP